MKSKILRDIHPPEIKKTQQVFFLRTDHQKQSTKSHHSEIIRVITGGLFILLFLNFINVYRRGAVIKNDTITRVASGYSNLVDGKNLARQAAFINSEDAFAAAAEDFETAAKNIAFLNDNRQIFSIHSVALASTQKLLGIGQNLAEAGELFMKSVENLRALPMLFFGEDSKQSVLPLEQLKKTLFLLDEAGTKIKIANHDLENIAAEKISMLDRSKFEKTKIAVDELLKILNRIENDIPAILKLLGDHALHRYLILLQNDAEARPTGGFIGSFLLVDVYQGHVIKNEFHDVYEFDGQLAEEISAPEDISKITKNWRLRDANFSPDFAISAEKAAWFLQKEKGPSVDTIIAINQHILGDFLDLTGPIVFDGLEAPLTKDNYQLIISYIVESKLHGRNDPKKILRDLIPIFQKKLLNAKVWNKIIEIIAKALLNKNILLYSRDADIQSFFDEKGISGRVIRTKPADDYLQITNTSVGGNKSDAFIQQEITHATFIGKNGQVNDEVALMRRHLWAKEQLQTWQKNLKEFNFNVPSEAIQNILGRGENKSSVRVYAPLGSVLLEVKGIDKNKVLTREDRELKKTYFLFEMDVAAGRDNAVSLKYALPQLLDLSGADTYRFFAQPQPSIRTVILNKIVYLDQDLKVYDKYPAQIRQINEKMFSISQELQKNLYLSILVGS